MKTVEQLKKEAAKMHDVRELTKTERKECYSNMYAEAQAETFGYYKGYTGANALSLWVDEKYGVNAAADGEAHNALFEYIQLINDPG